MNSINRLYLLVIFLLLSCNTAFEKTMLSTDVNFVMKAANDLVERKKYENAISLYEYLVPFVSGTNFASEVTYKLAEVNFIVKNYTLSGDQFKNFHTKFKNDLRAEDALYLSAMSYYKKSNEFNLDPSNTIDAIDQVQNFIDIYPNSNKIAKCKLIINELQYKLEKKAFHNALTLYKTAKYKSAVVAFSNIIFDFPDSKIRESAYYYSILSKYKLAKNSVYRLKKERIIETQTAIKLLLKEFPNSRFKNEINNQIESQINALLSDYEAKK